MQFDAKNPGLILFKKFDDRKNVYAGAFTSSAIKAWLEVNSLPSVLEFNDKAIDHIFRNGNPALFVFRSDSDAEKLD